jgi:PAS domain S-box-containing protein
LFLWELQGVAYLTAMENPDRQVTSKEFNDSPLLMAVVTPEGVVKLVNAAWEKTLGYRVDELVGRNLLRLADDADWAIARRVLNPRPDAPKGAAIDLSLKCKDGSYRGFEWESRRVAAEDTVFIVGKDVTDRRRLEVSQSLRMYELYAGARKKGDKKKT